MVARLTVAGILVCIAGVCLAGDAPTTSPNPNSEDVERVFQERLRASERQYSLDVRRAREERVKGLQELQDRAMSSQNLDTALMLREKIKGAEAELSQEPNFQSRRSPQAEMAALQSRLNGSLWHWGAEDFVRFEPNGTIANAGWTARGLLTSWKVIDRRTVLLVIERGRVQDRYAILTFTPNIDGYTGYGFEAAKPIGMLREQGHETGYSGG